MNQLPLFVLSHGWLSVKPSLNSLLKQENMCYFYQFKCGLIIITTIILQSLRGVPPRPSMLVKFNINGAFKGHTRQGGWGFVAKDHMGDVLGSVAG
jgi:hypothetical protein